MGFGVKTKIFRFYEEKKKSIFFLSRHIRNLYFKEKEARIFYKKLLVNYRSCKWHPHPQYSVFTQHDKAYYLKIKKQFLVKYRYFYAVSKTIRPSKLIEIGAFAGSSADAYLSATPSANYTGIDLFSEVNNTDTNEIFEPYKIANLLFKERGFSNINLIKMNLRDLDKLPHLADFVVVDAAHDFKNEYADLKLALTADPAFIFVDDADDQNQALPAIEKFIREDLLGKIEYCIPLNYVGGGLLIKLK
jgi:predicted O-methyltransferase YrrM